MMVLFEKSAMEGSSGSKEMSLLDLLIFNTTVAGVMQRDRWRYRISVLSPCILPSKVKASGKVQVPINWLGASSRVLTAAAGAGWRLT